MSEYNVKPWQVYQALANDDQKSLTALLCTMSHGELMALHEELIEFLGRVFVIMTCLEEADINETKIGRS